jgi:hypothetical protein
MLKRAFQSLLLVTLLAPTSWAASDTFIGKWKFNPAKSKMSDQMKVDSLGGNKYSFDFGPGGEAIVVDGTDQPGTAGTTLSVAILGADSWKVIRKQNGRIIITAIWTLSKDGAALMDDFTSIDANGSPHNTKYHYKRIAGGPGFAATWVSTTQMMDSDFLLEVRAFEGDGLSFVFGSAGEAMSMKFDGKDYPDSGVAGLVFSANKKNPRSLQITDKLNGKEIAKRQVEISSDGKTLTMTKRGMGQSMPNIMVFDRQ